MLSIYNSVNLFGFNASQGGYSFRCFMFLLNKFLQMFPKGIQIFLISDFHRMKVKNICKTKLSNLTI